MAIRILGAILYLVSFVFALLYALAATFAWGITRIFGGAGLITTGFGLCMVIFFAIAIFTFIGAFSALRGRNWAMALFGGVFAMFSLGPFFLGSICGFIGLVLIAIAKNEFDEQRRSMMGFKRPPRPSFYGPPPTRK